MAIKYPDFLQNNNPNAVLIDATENQTKGFGFFADTSERDALATALQVTGYLAIVGVTPYVYQGGGWTSASNWVEIGGGGLEHVVEDLSPQLGGDLEVNGFSIISAITNEDITFTPNGTGRINLDGSVQFKRFTTPPTAVEGMMYADTQDNLYFAVSDE